MLVVARIAGRELARPVERQAHRLQLALHRVDVGIGPVARIDLVVARGVLRRQAEGVPAHRMQHVAAVGAPEARHHVAHRVVAHVAHMDAPRRIGEHLEHVVFRARVVVARSRRAWPRPRLSASWVRTRADCIVRLPSGVNRFRRDAAVTFTTLCRNRQLRRIDAAADWTLGKTRGNPAWTSRSSNWARSRRGIAAAEREARAAQTGSSRWSPSPRRSTPSTSVR